jgi:hypothetical protein
MSIRLLLDQYPTKNAFSDGIRELVENQSNHIDKQVDFRERKKKSFLYDYFIKKIKRLPLIFYWP